MARSQSQPRTAYGRHVQARAVSRYRAAQSEKTLALMTSGVAIAAAGVGNAPATAALLSFAALMAQQGDERQREAQSTAAKGRAVENLMHRIKSSGRSEPAPAFDPFSRVRDPESPGVLPMERDTTKRLINAAHAIGSTRYHRALLKQAAAGDAVAQAIVEHNRSTTRSEVKSATDRMPDRRVVAPISGPQPIAGPVDALATTAGMASMMSSGQMARSTRKMARAAPTLGVRAQHGFAVASPFIMATAGGLAAKQAFDRARAAGATPREAAGAAALAAGPLAAAALAPTLIGRAAPKIAGAMSKAALPLLGLATGLAAVRSGTAAWKDGAGAGGVAKAAVLGAADSLTFGVASQVQGKVAAALASGRAYANDAAAAKDRQRVAAAAAPGPVSVRGPAEVPRSDGMTAGYTRLDPRSGKSVAVHEYRTPARG